MRCTRTLPTAPCSSTWRRSGHPELLPNVIAGVLGVAERPGRETIDMIGEWLADRRLLLILDNMEQSRRLRRSSSRMWSGAPVRSTS